MQKEIQRDSQGLQQKVRLCYYFYILLTYYQYMSQLAISKYAREIFKQNLHISRMDINQVRNT